MIRKIISLDFPGQKQVIYSDAIGTMFQFLVAAEAKNTVGINWGLLISTLLCCDIRMDLTFWRPRLNKCVFVPLVNKPGWSSVVVMKPRNLFAMPDEENVDEIDIDSIDLQSKP